MDYQHVFTPLTQNPKSCLLHICLIVSKSREFFPGEAKFPRVHFMAYATRFAGKIPTGIFIFNDFIELGMEFPVFKGIS